MAAGGGKSLTESKIGCCCISWFSALSPVISVIIGLNHITLSVADLEESIRFYVDVLSFTLVAHWPVGAYLESGSLWLALVLDSERQSIVSDEYSHIAFSTTQDGLSRLRELITSSGVRIWQENKSEGDSVYFCDPSGHKLEVHVGTLDSRLESMHRSPWADLTISGARDVDS